MNYSGITLVNRDHFGECAVEELLSGLLREHFGQYAVEELSCATQGPLWPVCCGRAKLRYSGATLASVLWKS